MVGEPLHQLDEGGALDERHARALLLVLEDDVLVRVDLGELVLVCGGQVEVSTRGYYYMVSHVVIGWVWLTVNPTQVHNYTGHLVFGQYRQ